MAAANLTRRVAFAALAIPAAAGVAYLGGWYLAALLAALGVLGAREIYDFAAAQRIDPLRRLGMLGAAALPLAAGGSVLAPGLWSAPASLPYAGAVWLIAILVAATWRRGPAGRPLAVVAVTVFGALYAGGLPSFALFLRHPLGVGAADTTTGTAILFFPLALTWVGDTAAYAGGSAFGGPKLAPLLSPNKTWSGAAAGLFGTVSAGLVYAAVVLRAVGLSLSLAETIIISVLIGVAGQLGDLAESLLKREAGVKDSSTLLPGHGGVLDRLDSLYFVLPVTVVLFRSLGLT